eukprot:7391950-Pyramimonas_sp.AAC.1
MSQNHVCFYFIGTFVLEALAKPIVLQDVGMRARRRARAHVAPASRNKGFLRQYVRSGVRANSTCARESPA